MSEKQCKCPACTALAKRYAKDARLLTLYCKKLLIRGWAGDTDKIEKAYIMAHAEWAQAVTANLKGHGFGAKRTNGEALPAEADSEHVAAIAAAS